MIAKACLARGGAEHTVLAMLGVQVYDMQTLELAVYSHDCRVRQLVFEPGALNAIAAGSKSGKSVIQQLVEYCSP